MTDRVRAGLAALGRMGRIHAASLATRCPSAELACVSDAGVIDESRAAGYGYEASTEVLGSRATARIDHPYGRHYEWRTPGQAGHGRPQDFEERFGPAYPNELAHFARCVRDGWPPSRPRPTRWPRSAWPGRPNNRGGPGAR